MWTPTTRQQHSRPVTRYQTDLTDAEWHVIAPHLPRPCAAGRPREWPMREIVNGIFYVMRAGCPWRLLPNDLPPWGTIYRWFAAWRDDGRFERINHALVMADREQVRARGQPLGRNHRQPERQDLGGWRATRLRCWKEDQRTQAPRAGRHRRAWPRARTASGEHPGSRRRRTASASLAAHLPVHSGRLRRQRICRAEGHHGDVDRRRNCAQKSQPNRLRCKPAPLGRRAVLRVDRAQSTAGKGLRGHHQLRTRLPSVRK